MPTRPPDIEGLVTEVRALEDGSLRILVEEISDFNFETAAVVEGGKKAYVRVTDRTELKDGVYQPSTRERIRVHERARARAWFTGAVTKSYPAHAEAEVFIFWILAP